MADVKLNKEQKQRLLKIFLEGFEAHKVLSKTLNIPMERKKAGKWEALWLKLTFRKPPMIYVMPESTGDTITIIRPREYTIAKPQPDPASDQQ